MTLQELQSYSDVETLFLAWRKVRKRSQKARTLKEWARWGCLEYKIQERLDELQKQNNAKRQKARRTRQQIEVDRMKKLAAKTAQQRGIPVKTQLELWGIKEGLT